MSAARREAAKRGLYSQFMRGQILKPLNGETTIVQADGSAGTPAAGASRKGKEREVVVGASFPRPLALLASSSA